MILDINKDITQHQLDKEQFFHTKYEKKQITLHHTAGRSNPFKEIDGWNYTEIEVATPFMIGGKFVNDKSGYEWKDGEIVQAHPSSSWAYHLGVVKDSFKKYGLPYTNLNKIAIGVEICNWGWLKEVEGKIYPYAAFNRKTGALVYKSMSVPKEDAVFYPNKFKGHRYYQKYTDAQIESLRKLLLYLSETYDIPLNYHEDIFDLTKRAFAAEKGLFTHNSYRSDKSDIHPQPEMINMLKNLI